MTTKAQPTPYDAQIARMTADSPRKSSQQQDILAHLRSLREGYLAAKAEDAALLLAAHNLMAEAQAQAWCPICKARECECWSELADGIALAEGKKGKE